MQLFNIKQWQLDIDKILPELFELDSLSGKSILITGSTGLICSAVVDVLFRYNDTAGTGIQIYIAGRSREKMAARFPEQINSYDFHFVQYDAAGVNNQLPEGIDYIIHGASNASPNHIVKEPVETMMSKFYWYEEVTGLCS